MSNDFPMYMPPAPPLQDLPFEFDKLEREPLARVLSGYVQRLASGAVVAVDAEWGQGKTWFAQNWSKHLEAAGHPVTYIDAFQSDYIEDPFSLIVGEIVGLIKSKNKKKAFIEKATNVALAIAPTALKVALRGGGKIILGVADLDEKLQEAAEKLVDKGEDALGKVLEDKIKRYEDNKNSIKAFRECLATFAAESEKPLVVIIDELDRCRPEFAVNLIERIKHFFDVKNVVFVLFLNKRQLQNAIKGVHGVATDAHTYLEKFLTFTFTLEQPRFGKMRPFVEAELAKYKFPANEQVREFVDGLCALTDAFTFTPRQIERAIALLALAHPVKTAAILLAELVVLKISRPDLLDGLLRDDIALQTELLKILLEQERKNEGKSVSKTDLEFFITVHRALLERGDERNTLVLRNHYQLTKDRVRRDYAAVMQLLNWMPR